MSASAWTKSSNITQLASKLRRAAKQRNADPWCEVSRHYSAACNSTPAKERLMLRPQLQRRLHSTSLSSSASEANGMELPTYTRVIETTRDR